MTRKRKLLMALPSLATGASLLSLAASCGTSATVVSKQQYATSYNAIYKPLAYTFDATNQYGGYNAGDLRQTFSVSLVRLKGLNGAVTANYQSTVQLQNGTTDEETKTYIVKPVFVKKSLDAVKAIVLTLKDGTVKVYDNDKAEIEPEADTTVTATVDGQQTELKAYSKLNVRLESADSGSINNPQFELDLDQTTNMQMVIREGIKYVDNNGNDTGYTVQPKDFYLTWLRTKLLSTGYRLANGGTAALDNWIRDNLLEEGNVSFSKDEEYPNEYLYGIYGIDAAKMTSEDSFLTKVTNQTIREQLGLAEDAKALTFSTIDNTQTVSYGDLFRKLILTDKTLLPLSSQYVEAENAKLAKVVADYKANHAGVDLTQEANLTDLGKYAVSQGINIYRYTDLSVAADPAIEKGTLALGKFLANYDAIDHSSAAYQTGLYWHGVSSRSSLYSGPYYAKGYGNLSQTYIKNSHYYDEKFVNNQNTINSIVYKYQSNEVKPNIYQTRILQQYSNNELIRIGFSQLNDKQKEEVLRNESRYGLRYSQSLNKTQPYYQSILLPFAYNAGEEQGENYYYFNDAYSLLMWGKTRAQLAKGLDDGSSFLKGNGLSFRTIINAATNYSYLANKATSGVETAYLGNVALDSSIGGSDQNTTTGAKTPREVIDELNQFFAIDKDGNKINFASSGDAKYTISTKENMEAELKAKYEVDKAKSAVFEQLKAEMKKLLDAFYEANPSLVSKSNGQKVYEPIKFKLWYPWSNLGDNLKSASETLTRVLSELDSRIVAEVDWERDPAKNRARWLNGSSYGSNGSTRLAWGYDYDSVGSGIDGLSWNGQLIPTLTYLYAHKDEPSVANNFPELIKAATALMAYEQTNPSHWDVPVADLYKIEGKIWYRGFLALMENKIEWSSTINKYIVNDAEGVVREGEHAEDGQDPYGWSALFWFKYTKDHTNQEMINLLKEITTLYGYDFMTANKASINEFSPVLINNNFEAPIMLDLSADYIQDWSIRK